MSIILFSFDELSEAAKELVEKRQGKNPVGYFTGCGNETYMLSSAILLTASNIISYLGRNWHEVVLPFLTKEIGCGLPPSIITSQAFKTSLEGVVDMLEKPCNISFRGNRTNISNSSMRVDELRFAYADKNPKKKGVRSFFLKQGCKTLSSQDILDIMLMIIYYHTSAEEMKYGDYITKWPIHKAYSLW